MKKTLLYSVIALALVLGLALPMAMPLMASESLPSKHRDPDESPYDVGDTIYWVMNITNPLTNPYTNTYTRIWETLPDSTVIEFLYPGSPYGNAAGGSVLILSPGESAAFNASYVVRSVDLEWITPPLADPYWGVRNVFQAEGTDPSPDIIDDRVEDVAEVIPLEPVGGEAFHIGKLSVLLPWIALGTVIIAGAGIFVRRRRARS